MAKQRKQVAKCSDFEMDLTDYVLGETTFLTKEKQEQLFQHLRECPKCLEELWNWKMTVGILRAKAQSGKPEFQQRIKQLIEQVEKELLNCKPLPGTRKVDIKEHIGKPAGEIWLYLAPRCWVHTDVIAKETSLKPRVVDKAIGWLGREGKLMISMDDKRNVYACLSPDEKKAYFAHPFRDGQAGEI